MKSSLITFAIFVVSIFARLHAEPIERIWFSADEKKEITATLLSFDGEKTAVINRNGHEISFDISLLSESDQEWLHNYVTPLPKVTSMTTEEYQSSLMGKALAQTKKLAGTKFTSAPLKEAPKYLLLYYSASW